jgi:hypothetical protein
MAKLINLRLFSQHFGINPTELDKESLLDPVLNADTKLFVDPLLPKGSSHPFCKARVSRHLSSGCPILSNSSAMVMRHGRPR